MTGGVGHDIERLALIVRSVVKEPRAELLRTLTVSLKVRFRGHRKVHVHLHRNLLGWPGGRCGVLLLLDRHDTVFVVVNKDQPVCVVATAVAGDLVAGSVMQAQQFPIKLREAAAVSGVDCSVEQHRVSGHGPVSSRSSCAARVTLARYRPT